MALHLLQEEITAAIQEVEEIDSAVEAVALELSGVNSWWNGALTSGQKKRAELIKAGNAENGFLKAYAEANPKEWEEVKVSCC